ncbi:hypothetical protein SLS58_002938 [Diplodia intermedia]|uniref:Uncharacterized protein n=1 Tax=Diplodia intermedia TaxID=856260 RepID=A0ABR3TYW1_9PEZI
MSMEQPHPHLCNWHKARLLSPLKDKCAADTSTISGMSELELLSLSVSSHSNSQAVATTTTTGSSTALDFDDFINVGAYYLPSSDDGDADDEKDELDDKKGGGSGSRDDAERKGEEPARTG